MKPRHKRLLAIVGGLAALGAAAALVLTAFEKNLVFFFTPVAGRRERSAAGRLFRVGGLVEKGSVKRDGVAVHFVVTDTAKSIPVVYNGLLPDLFREGKGVVTQGTLGADGVFQAREVLAKHDENYMPPEAAEAREKGAEDAARQMIPELGQVRALPRARRRAGAGASCRSSARARHAAWMRSRVRRRRRSSCSSRSPSAASPGRFVTNDFSVLVRRDRTPTARCRCSIASPACGAATKARSCCGC